MIEALAAEALKTAAAESLGTAAEKALETPVGKNLENPVNIEPTEKEKIADWWDKELTNFSEQNKPNDANEENKYMGGSYEEVKWNYSGHGEEYEVHHIPANSASDLPTSDGPAIAMDKADHLQTASYGYSKEAMEYRQEQRELIKQGKFMEAFQMDVNDIREKFGDKYDKAIAEAREYVKKLEEEGRV